MSLKPGVIEDIIRQAETLKLKQDYKIPTKRKCEKCGDISSNKICKSCFFIDDLKKIEKKTKQELTLEDN